MNDSISQSSYAQSEAGEISETILGRIRNEFEATITKYQGLLDEEASECALRKLSNLNNSIQSLQSGLFHFFSEAKSSDTINEDQEKIFALYEELQAMMQSIHELSLSAKELKNMSDQLIRDVHPDGNVEILNVKRKYDKWSIKLKASENSNGNFRNLGVFEKSSSSPVCLLAIVEAGDIVKVEVEASLHEGSVIIAKISDTEVSAPYIVK